MPYIKTLRGYQNVTIEQLRALRRIPQNAVAIEEQGLGVAYVYPAAKPGYYGVVAYRGNASKSDFHFIYKTDADVDRKIKDWFDCLRSWKDRVAKRRAEDFAGHSFKTGQIVYTSWGYDQTNVDWFRVMRTTKNYVWIQPLVGDVEETGFMSGNTEPAVDTSDADPTKWDVKTHGALTKHRASGDNITMPHGVGRKWDGRRVHCSWYA